MEFTFEAELWLYEGKGAWVFVTLPEDIAAEIKSVTDGILKRGFNSVKVSVSVDGISWKTSIFPDNKRKSYILPIKKDIRSQASIDIGDNCLFLLRVVDA